MGRPPLGGRRQSAPMQRDYVGSRPLRVHQQIQILSPRIERRLYCSRVPLIWIASRSIHTSAAVVLDLLAAGVSEAEVLADFPYLESEDIRACLAFAAAEADHPVLVAADR
jgi:hypothetical protein